MKRNIKITGWAIGAIILLSGCIIGGFLIKNYLYEKFNPPFEETTIFVMGGSYETEKENCKIDAHDVYHANIKMGSTGLRLVCYPEAVEKQN